MKRVVITGMGAVTAFGNDVETMFQHIIDNRCAIKPITHFDTSNFKVKLAAAIDDFHGDPFFDARDFRFNDRFSQFARLASKLAYTQAKLDHHDIDRYRFGVVFGSGIGGITSMEKAKENLDQRGPHRIFPHFIPMTILNAAAGLIAIDLQAKGTCVPVVTGCAAGSDAIGQGYLKIKHGLLDLALVGASEASITPLGVGGFMAMKALYEGDTINRASIPFDKERAGFVMGEGAGALILENYEVAKRRNAPIYGELVGYGSTCDDFHITAPIADGAGIENAMRMACTDAKLEPQKIGYINAHGTSTTLNDKTEIKAIRSIFKHQNHLPFISSTKSHLGHLLGACGVIEAMICLQALKQSIIPATINLQQIDPECDFNIVAIQPIKKDIDYAMSNSLGFGGHNAVLIFRKWK
ncbi:MAG: beta-ketoacyl-ACP synthase II [Erysipelothrix sp.]|nr:beta-ketoacyl-ACP synthase II [Erysipelothrix sp.]